METTLVTRQGKSCASNLCMLIFTIILTYTSGFSEGTRQIRPSATDYGYVVLDPAWSPFGLYNCPSTSRIHIRICNVGEKIYYGFNQSQGDVRYRIKDPNGNIVVAETTVPTTGNGFISNYTRAFNGPSAVVGATGYTALQYTPTQTGDYYIEFRLPNGSPRREFNYFDITVASAADQRINGRVWCQSWMFSTGDYGRAFRGLLYIYADDGIVTSLDFNGMDPYVFVLNANQTGTGNTGNPAVDRQSKVGSSTYPQYKVFMNNPDEGCFPTGSFGQITQPTTVTGCPPNNFCINVFANKIGRAEVVLDLNGVAGFQSGTADRILSQDIIPPSTCIPWDGRDGLGNIVSSSVSLTTTVNFYNGLTHIPLYDVERNPNGYRVTLVRPTGPVPQLFYDDSQIPAAGGATNLNGCTSPCHTWNWNCCGNNPGTDYGNTNTINTWWYADSTRSISTHAVLPAIVVDADTRDNGGSGDNDTIICSNRSSFTLSGSVLNAGGGTWTTSGSGTFSPGNTSLTGTYNISAGDIAAGNIRLILTSTGNGACPEVKDTLLLRFQTAPSVNAGGDINVCANNPTVTLNGSFSNAGGATWTSSGTGTFSPSANSLNATYTASAADVTNGTVTLTLTTTGNGNCTSVSDQMIITIHPSPVAASGNDQTVCSNNATVTLSGTVTNATSQSWTGGAGTFSPNNTTLNATYTPTAAEITAGTVNLTLTAVRNGCNSVSDNVILTINPAPVVNAGADQSVCHNNAAVTLSGTVTNTTTYQWTGGSGTFAPGSTSLNTVYVPTLAERNSGSFVVTLTATGTGCTPVSDQLTVSITSAPTANAGTGTTRCANNPAINLNGSVGGASGGTWIGCGTFFPDANTLNAVYTPCASEITNGIAALILSTTGNGNCSAMTDTVLYIISRAPTANAGPDRSVCSNNPAVTLNGSVTNASSFSWSGGSGVFSPNNSTLNATYTPSASDISDGSVTLTLSASRPNCITVTDQIVITFTPAPIINAGNDQSVCHNNATITLNGSVTTSTGGTWSGGSGTFTPNANTLNAQYTPTLTERNAGSVTLTVTSTGNGNCNPVNDQVTISITPSPTVNAGNDQVVCSNNPAVTLNGNVTVASGGVWSGGNGVFNPNTSDLNAQYIPTAAEIESGAITLTLTSTGNGDCNPVSDQVTVTFSSAPTANAGSDITICADNPVASLNGIITVATGGTWSGGSGTFNPTANTSNTSYIPTVAEINAGSITLILTTTGNGTCNPVSDNVTINIQDAPTINAGTDQSVCAASTNVSLNGTVAGSSGGQWTTSGTGSFNPNASTLNATYVPSAADKTTGNTVTLTLTSTGNGSCIAVSDQILVSFTGVPEANAGPDQIVCTNNFPIQLNGSGSASVWSGGNGTFTPTASTLNATYIPTASEISNGSITLTLTSIPSGACPTVSDQVTITLPPAPIANAGTDATMCGNASSFTLAGDVDNAGGGFWSTSGTGSFNPNPNSLTASYHPSALDLTNGSVTLTLTTVANGSCSGHSDNMILTIQPGIEVSAGPDQTLCADQNSFVLSAAFITNAPSGTWTSSGSGSFSPDANTINSSYVPSAADKLAGSVTLTLTTAANATCPALSDQVVYTITPAPTANAGADQTICADAGTINLNGNVTVATMGSWSTAGTGTFTPDGSSLNTSYIPSAADISAGTVTFTLTTTDNGTCNPVSDQLTVTITTAPTISAGIDQTVCADIGSVSINGTVTIATGGTWSTGGDGTFANANTINTSYTPGTNDISNGTVTLTLSSTGNGTCIAVQDQVVLTITPAPTINAGPDRMICSNNATVALSGSVTVATGAVWSGGSGTFTPNNTTLNAIYTPTAAEIATGSVTLTLTSTGNGLCNAVTDQVTITITESPTVSAGPDHTICADSSGITLSSTVTIAGGVMWSTSGSGNFFPNTITQNATYVPSALDRTVGTVTISIVTTSNGNCLAVRDTMIISITPAPTVEAGNNQIVCANNASITLNGSVTIASGGMWATSGSGSFASAASTSTTYTPSALDAAAGSVTLTLTTTGNGTCRPVSDQLTISITPSPVVNAGGDQTVCANNPDAILNGQVTVASGAQWTTSGNGVFVPNATTLNATYQPSPADIASGNVTLTLTSTGNGLCNAESDQLTITITPAPTVDAGEDKTICADATGISLNGEFTIASGVLWTSSGSGIFSPSAADENAIYAPSPADTTAGSVTLTLTTTGNGNCLAVSDQMTLTINPAPVVNAGPDQTVCGNVEFINLSGIVANATGGTWSTSGSGFFSPANALSTQYLLSGSELNGGSITLTLSSTGHGTCNQVSDQLIINIDPTPAANAGSDRTVCANNSAVTLNGSVTNAGGAMWTSSGDGTFSDPASLTAVYTPSADDIAAGTVALSLETTGTGACNPSRDQMILTITPAPTVSAGNDQSVCANNAMVQLNGSILTASGGTWSSSGTGTFSPSLSALDATYTPSAADIGNGSVTLTLTSTGNGNCNAVNDNVIITITPAPTVNPGTPQTVCANTSGVSLNGLITVSSGGTWSTTSGTGTFLPNATTLNATFIPSPTQIANGRANLTLTTTGNGNCAVVSATVVITIQPVPTANAGPNVQVCTGTPSIPLNGIITNVGGATWSSSGSGSFNPGPTSLNAIYEPSAADNVDGNVITLTLTTSGNGFCNAVSSQMTITFQTTPVNAGPDQTVCSNSLPVQLNGSGNGTWSGGSGTFSDPTSLNSSYTPAAGEIPGTITLTLTGTAVGTCTPGTDDVIITIVPGPEALAGSDQLICANNAVINLNGVVNNAGGGTWDSEGSGIFVDNNSLNTTYTASAADVASGSIKLTLTTTGNGICNADTDTTLLITFTPAPVVFAGSDQAACENSGPVNLTGTVTIAPGATWSIVTGNGTITDPTQLTTTYVPDAADITSGFVILRLTSLPASNCNLVSDEMRISFGSAPTASTGSDQTICEDAYAVTLSGSITVSSGGKWSSSGDGIFTPDPNNLTASYIPSANDKTNGSVRLVLATTGNGTCNAVTDTMFVTITDAPTVTAGADQTVCADITSISISGTVNIATGGKWFTSGNGTFGDENSLITTYTPSASDKSKGSIVLTLESTGNGNCNAYSDQLTVFFTPSPSVFAGLDQTACKDVTSLTLNGTVTVATGGSWISTGNGTFDNSNSVNTTYTPSATDKANGPVILTLTTTGNGSCQAVSDQVELKFTDAPTVNAGQDAQTCADKDTVHLSSSFTIASGMLWTTNGTGTFSPGANHPNAVYYMSASDKATGNITLSVSTTGNGTCNPVSDQKTISIAPRPIVEAGPHRILCAGQANVTLNGSVSNAGGGIWSSTGTGSFLSNTSLSTTYIPSIQDYANGGILITLTSTANGTCAPVSDIAGINIISSPSAIVNSGLDQTLCSDIQQIKTFGFVSNAGGGIWSSSGTGTFIPGATTLEGVYVPSANDITTGSIVLTLTTTDNGTCSAVSDNMMITFTPAPTVNAGIDQTICGDASGIATLNGVIQVATGGIWTTSGSGTFAPDPITLTNVYYPSPADIAAGRVGLTLTSTGNGTCNPVSDLMNITITKPPKVNAGNDQTLCSNTSFILLNGSVTNANGGTWTSSGNGQFDDANSLFNSYDPGNKDLNDKVVTFTLTSTGNNGCLAVSDQLKVTFIDEPVADAGAVNIRVCATATSVDLAGEVENATGGIWTTTGSGNFSNANTLTTNYFPSDSDRSAGVITLSLITIGNSTCPSDTDQVTLRFQQPPTANAKAKPMCDVKKGAELDGAVGNAGGGIWSTSGSGVFSPNPITLKATYFASTSDITSGEVTLTLTTTSNGSCSPATNNAKLKFKSSPVANAGQDQTVCPGSEATLTAVVAPTNTYSWSTTTGTPINTSPVTNVTVNADTSFVLTVTDDRGCDSKDTVNVTVFGLPSFTMNANYCMTNNLILESNPAPQPTVPGVYQWFHNNQIMTGNNTPVISPIEKGTYTIVFSYGNCSSSGSTMVNEPPTLVGQFITDCIGKNTAITIFSNVPGSNYSWSNGEAGINLSTINVTVDADTNYYVATVTDAVGCSSKDSVRVIGVPVPMLNLPDISSCVGLTELLIGRPTNISNIDELNPTYAWFNNTTTLPVTNDTLSVNSDGMYHVAVTIGQCIARDTAVVAMNPVPSAVLPDKVKFCKETDNYVLLNAGAGSGYNYLWTAPAGAVLDSNNSQTVPARFEGYFGVTVTNTFNCSSVDSVFVDEICPPRLFVPTGITPGSGSDGKLQVFGAYFTNFKITVFNRWGEVIFESTDRNVSWDGTYMGEPMPVGVYPWIVTYEGEDPEMKGPYRQEGSVTIVR